MSPRRIGAAAAAAAFASLAGLVAAGTLTRPDQWAVDHAMPGGLGVGRAPGLAESVVPLLHAHWSSAVGVAANVVTLPAQALLSFVVVAACCLVLRARGRLAEAAAWAALWIGANAVEVLCKAVLTRPALYRDGMHVAAFDSSFPSGHALRTVLVAATVAAAWPSARRPLAAWAAASVVLLELAGFHVPTDIAGGLLLAALALVVRPAR